MPIPDSRFIYKTILCPSPIANLLFTELQHMVRIPVGFSYFTIHFYIESYAVI